MFRPGPMFSIVGAWAAKGPSKRRLQSWAAGFGPSVSGKAGGPPALEQGRGRSSKQALPAGDGWVPAGRAQRKGLFSQSGRWRHVIGLALLGKSWSRKVFSSASVSSFPPPSSEVGRRARGSLPLSPGLGKVLVVSLPMGAARDLEPCLRHAIRP